MPANWAATSRSASSRTTAASSGSWRSASRRAAGSTTARGSGVVTNSAAGGSSGPLAGGVSGGDARSCPASISSPSSPNRSPQRARTGQAGATRSRRRLLQRSIAAQPALSLKKGFLSARSTENLPMVRVFLILQAPGKTGENGLFAAQHAGWSCRLCPMKAAAAALPGPHRVNACWGWCVPLRRRWQHVCCG